jgi:hypothetical protein
MIAVTQWGNLNGWTYLHKVAVLFSLAEKTNHGWVWPEPLLSISTCLYVIVEIRRKFSELQHFLRFFVMETSTKKMLGDLDKMSGN